MMRRLIPRLGMLSIALLGIGGCGKPKLPTPPQAPPRLAVPAPAPAAAAPANAPAAAPAAADASPKGKAKSKAHVSRATTAMLANADPKSLFVVSNEGEPVEVESIDGIEPSERFQVATANVAGNSMNLEVQSANRSPQSQSFFGIEKPKTTVALPKGFSVAPGWGYTTEGLPMRIVCEKTGSMLAVVPVGISIVGSDTGHDDCKPSFKVKLDTFYMEVLEVTIDQFERYRAEMREKKKTIPSSPVNATSDPEYPALGISLANAQNYARWAGMELPTEAEFEKAARGPTGLRTPWGDGKPLWADRKITKTGAFATDRSPYGIFDLAGNAKEWCSDLYSATSHKDAAASSSKEMLHSWPGPKIVRDMNLRVVKGNDQDWSSWHREGKDAGRPHADVGFRCILRISGESETPAKRTLPAGTP